MFWKSRCGLIDEKIIQLLWHLVCLFGNPWVELTGTLFTTEQQLQQMYYWYAVLLYCYLTKSWHKLCCCSFFFVQRIRQDLTSILIKSTNWFSDAYPVAHMRWLIIGFVCLQRMSETESNHFKLPNIFQLLHV